MKFRKKLTIIMFVSIHIFTAIMIAVYCVRGDVPNELIICYFGFWGVEGGAMAWIKNTDTNAKKNKKPPTDGMGGT